MKNITITENMKKAGNKMASDLISAYCSKAMNGLGGGETWDEFVENFSGKNLDLIYQYINEEIDSVSAMCIAMYREIEPDHEATIVMDELPVSSGDTMFAYHALPNAFVALSPDKTQLTIFPSGGGYLEVDTKFLCGDIAPFSD